MYGNVVLMQPIKSQIFLKDILFFLKLFLSTIYILDTIFSLYELYFLLTAIFRVGVYEAKKSLGQLNFSLHLFIYII